MTSKKRPSGRSNLCVIVDRGFLDERTIARVARQAARGGADMIQYRDKSSPTPSLVRTAKRIRAAVKPYGSVFIVNDRPDVARAARADGVHVGRGDADCAVARALVGSDRIVGVSVSSAADARQARRDGADYVGAGPVFRTPVKKGKKPLGAAFLANIGSLGIPVMAIGGITRDNIDRLTRRGFVSVAVIRAVARARDPYRATKELKALL